MNKRLEESRKEVEMCVWMHFEFYMATLLLIPLPIACIDITCIIIKHCPKF
jgi:hypothetical protein